MKIYVGNLPNSVTEQELQELFSTYGAVISARIIKDKFTGQPRGFGFVEIEDNDAAQAAINGLNGTECKGQRLRINEARPPQERTGGFGGRSGGNRGGGGGGHAVPARRPAGKSRPAPALRRCGRSSPGPRSPGAPHVA